MSTRPDKQELFSKKERYENRGHHITICNFQEQVLEKSLHGQITRVEIVEESKHREVEPS